MHNRFHPSEPFEPTLHAARIDQPARWCKPRVVFVCNTGDLFHKDVPDGYIRSVFQAMADTPRHTFLLLTKRAERMSRWAYRWGPNVWAGVTAENQAMADERIPLLLATPAAHRWVSVEPMLEPINLRNYMWPTHWHWDSKFSTPEEALAAGAFAKRKRQGLVLQGSAFLDQVIAGCESGHGMRDCQDAWLLDIARQCEEAGTPCFIKQHRQGGKLVTDPAAFPPDLRIRNLAWRRETP